MPVHHRYKDRNLFYASAPTTKGLLIDTNNPPDIHLFDGLKTRQVSKNVVSATTFDDPFYYGQPIWIKQVLVGGLRDNYSPGEKIVLYVDNKNDHLLHNTENVEMTYIWTTASGKEYEGALITMDAPEASTVMEVYGTSIHGDTVRTTFTVIVDENTVPIPRLQALQGLRGTYSIHKVLNYEAYTPFGGADLEWRDQNSNDITTTSGETFRQDFSSEIGTTIKEVRAKTTNGVYSAWSTVTVTSTSEVNSLQNNGAIFWAVDPISKVPLTLAGGEVPVGEIMYLKAFITSGGTINGIEDGKEIEIISVSGAKLLNPGTFRNNELIEVLILPQPSDYTIDIRYHYRQMGTIGGIAKTHSLNMPSNPQGSYSFDIILPNLLAAGSTPTMSVGDRHCVPAGAYTYTVNSAGVTALGLFGDDTHRRDVNHLLQVPCNISPVNQNTTVTFTFYDILDNIVTTKDFDIEIVSGVTPLANFQNPTDIGIGTSFSSTGDIVVSYNIDDPTINDRLSYIPENLNVYDIYNISDPKLMTNKLGDYEFRGSEEYPEEFYRVSDLEQHILNGKQPRDPLTGVRRFDFEIVLNGSELTCFSGKISANSNSIEVKHQVIIPNQLGGGRILYDGTSYHTSGTPYQPLQGLISGLIGTVDQHHWRAYAVGPSLEILLVFKMEIATATVGKTIIQYRENGVDKYIYHDPDNNVEDRNIRNVLNLSSVDDLKVLSLGFTSSVIITV